MEVIRPTKDHHPPATEHTPDESILTNLEAKIRTKFLEVRNIDVTERYKLNKVHLTTGMKEQINVANQVLRNLPQEDRLILEDINILMYAKANVTAGELHKCPAKKIIDDPPWKKRIRKTTESLRSDLSVILEYKKGVCTSKVCRKIENIKRRYRTVEKLDEVEHQNECTSKGARPKKIHKKKRPVPSKQDL